MLASAQEVRTRSTEVASGVRAVRADCRARRCSAMWTSRADVELGRAGMRRCRKEGLVVGFRRRVSGRARAVRWVERREEMVGRWEGRVV
jgi:hypothetical protein